MPRLYPLYSSSKGNCSYIGTRSGGILIDCGVSCRKVQQALAANEIPVSAVRGIFITHEHSDHIKGLKMFTKTYNIPVYAQAGTLDFLYDKEQIMSRAVEISGGTEIGDMLVEPFDTMHDAASPCGYRITSGDSVCAVCTDLGTVTDRVRKGVCGASAVLLEANYDEGMLKNGPYPYELKQRISCDIGHLSNRQSGEFASELLDSGTQSIVLAHLSENNNTPEAAWSAVEGILRRDGHEHGRDHMLTVAAPDGCRYVSF